MSRRATFLAASLAMVMFSTVGWASVTTWTATTGDWTVPGNWDVGAPTSSQDTRITNGGTVTIGVGEAAAAGSLNLGLDTNSDNVGNGINVGNLVMNGGTFSVGTTGNFIIGEGNHLFAGVGTFTLNAGTVDTNHTNIRLGAFGGTGTITQNGGILGSQDFTWNINPFNSNATAYYIGQEGGTGTYNLTFGTLNSPWTSLGYGGQGYWCGTSGYRNAPLTLNGTAPGWGYFNQSGGTHNTGDLTVGGGWDSGGFGTYTMTDGNLNATNIQLGELDGNGTGNQTVSNPTLGVNSQISPVGVFNQSGGTVTVTGSLVVGSGLCNFGAYGGRGIGTYNFSGGTLTDGGHGAGMIVANGAGATGTFEGSGAVNFSGTLTNNGRVIANGGTLNLSSFGSVTSTVSMANLPSNSYNTNGWFAVNGGQLLLPSINVTDNGDYNWGQAAGTLTQLNSVKVTVSGLTSSGSLNISLLDPSNATVPAHSGLGAGFFDVWNIATGFSASSTTLTFRCDKPFPDGGASSLNAGNLELFKYSGGTWNLVTGTTVNATNMTISADGQSAGYYALAATGYSFVKGSSANWANAGSWDNGLPSSSVHALVTNGETVTINTAGAVTKNLYVGGANGATGQVVMNSGTLDVTGAAAYIGYGQDGIGTFTLNGGTITFEANIQLEVGIWGAASGAFKQTGGTINYLPGGANFYVGGYGTGTYNLLGGTLNSPYTQVGYGGNTNWSNRYSGAPKPGLGYFVQTGGIHNTPTLTVGAGYDNGGTGIYTISGSTATLSVTDMELGDTDVLPGVSPNNPNLMAPNGTFYQNGGTVTVTHEIKIGAEFDHSGDPGEAGTGAYYFHGGTLTDGGAGASLVVREGPSATGTFQGRGVVSFTGALTNNGQVIADGGTLNLSSFSAATRTLANTTTNGWFAKNGGKLVLPAVVATAAAPSANWGENPTASTLTLVNSAKVTVHGLVGSASFGISLDDPANSEVPNHSGLSNVVGIWNVGVTPSGSFTSWDLALRYDDVAAGSAETSLGLFECTGGAWIKVPDTLDIADHVISAATLNLPAGAFFAVGTTIGGDVNLDGAVNSLDIDAIYRHLTVLPPGFTGWNGVGGNQPWPWAQSTYKGQYDVNYDGTVSQDDVTYELQTYFLTSYGDADFNRATDFQDFQALLDHWQNSGAGIGWAQADFNGDGVVDFLDFQNLLDYWNPSGWNFAPTQTPEPASLSLILLGGLALLRRSRK